ncbi:xanthine dehydrogenase family protein molybdopterin-binding subunit [Oceaniglobus roseus]|uniref:xanthine dehydrogenase family protein molybdopterin-binding subunit n=1 Tax=Oceaniglobus roseus TaxID=1737570 RepID=UPI000C7F5AB1|nr:xanthine dehydrogenase family protein molybdopterin-binding subunit [Kandeliimicrobium roseum]
MDFNTAAETNIFDRPKILGKAVPRRDGPLKTTGRAPYAYERHDVAEGQLVGYPLGSAIAKGRILSMDTEAARAAPGVRAIVTTLDMEAMPVPSEMHTAHLFGGDKVEHYHQAIAVVVAETFEQARAATALIKVEYDADEGAEFDLLAAYEKMKDTPVDPEVSKGDFETAFANAAHRIDRTYVTTPQNHAQMEPQATVAAWDENGNVTLWTSNQMIQWAKKAVAKTFEMDVEKVRVDSPYVGGGFGNKLFIRSDVVLAALGAKAAGQPVKLAMPRPFVMNNTTHRAGTVQRIRIGTDAQGKIVALAHEGTSNTLPGGSGEDATNQSQHFYAADTLLIATRLAEMHLPEANAMRAPGEASGLMGLEMAMDEMAEELGMDPVQFRLVNDTDTSPATGKKFSDRNFARCLTEGAERFGWENRNTTPGSRREGDWLIGHGVAGAFRPSPATTSGARVRLQADGRIIVETDMTDIGTGSYTIIAQTVAEAMGMDIEDVEVRLGDSAFPVSSGSGGQFGAVSSTAGAYAACTALRREVARRIGHNDADGLSFARGNVTAGAKETPLVDIAPEGEIVAEDKVKFGSFRKDRMVATFAAHFVEVGVNAWTGEVRVRRMLGVCDAGRIMNPTTALSQVIGGMVMGVGAALSEEIAVDTAKGVFINHDLANYEVPVHADIPEQEVVFLDTLDPVSGPLKSKGVGELGLCGVAGAVANAVYNATGVRAREYPITLDKLLDGLPEV